jgi:hypothetical protein
MHVALRSLTPNRFSRGFMRLLFFPRGRGPALVVALVPGSAGTGTEHSSAIVLADPSVEQTKEQLISNSPGHIAPITYGQLLTDDVIRIAITIFAFSV